MIFVNRKPVIGILATSNYMVSDDCFLDTYRYGNNYIRKLVELGAVPLLIPFCDEKIIEESLAMCDGLLLPGGSRIRPVNFEVIDYFYQKKKPILGICMGMQTLAMYSVNKESTEVKRIIEKIPSDQHWPVEVKRNNSNITVHKDNVLSDSKLAKIIGQTEIEVNSVHHNCIITVGSEFMVSARSLDGIIEGIEYKGNDRFIIGVQFHPELLPQFNNIFEKFIAECQKDR